MLAERQDSLQAYLLWPMISQMEEAVVVVEEDLSYQEVVVAEVVDQGDDLH